MKIVLISDTHGLHKSMLHLLPERADVLIHAGDCTNIGNQNDVREFMYWFQNLKGFDTKIFIAGNHDWAFEKKPAWLRELINEENLSQSDVVYLEEEEFILQSPEFSRPLKFYGSPYQPRFFDWAFNVDRDKMNVYWERIPRDTDVLITHTPPQGILDLTLHGDRTGCSYLKCHIEQIKPALHIFGHIHEGYGYTTMGNTLFINASICNRSYSPINKPIIVDLTEVNGKIIANFI